LLGEHTAEILSELVGLSPDEITGLTSADVIGTIPIAAR
jgi:hypothetical protein